MECPECGYVLDPFELDCPRCKRKEKRAGPGSTNSLPASSWEVPREAVPYHGDAVVRPPSRLGKGGELTAMLVGAVLFNLALVGGLVLVIYSVERFAPQRGVPPEALPLMRRILGIITAFPLAALVGVIGMLFWQRWGFYLFHACAALPLLTFLFVGQLHWHVLWSLILIVPSMLIFVLSMMRWDEFY